ncbi:MAG: hypothetical protein JHC64_26140 [Mycolicibacterium sp.]|nr:hypothetical protein [Mycolicibacterium sp.]
MSATEAESIAAVERSPQAAGAHDRDGWVGLFADLETRPRRIRAVRVFTDDGWT